jgi:carboxypeptidase C (cathepsin A)
MGSMMFNGPMRVKHGKFVPAPEGSWADDYNVIYLDQPVGTGYSFGNSLITNQQDGAKEFIKFFNKFYEMYPELKANELYLTGESYGGKYLSLFTYEILEKTDFNLAATLISDPSASTLYERTEMHVVPAALGIIDENQLDQVASLEQKCWAHYTDNYSGGAHTCHSIMSYIQDVSGGVAWHDARIFDYDFSQKTSQVSELLKDKEVIKALHV